MALSHKMVEAGAGIFARSGQLFSGGPPEGLLQDLHPSARLVGLFVLVLALGMTTSPIVLAASFTAALMLAIISYLDLFSIFKAALVPVVLFAIPSWLVSSLLSGQGYEYGALFFLRAVSSVIVVLVGLHSIGLRNIRPVLKWMRVPLELRLIWSIMVAQVVSFSEMMTEMAFAREARMVRPVPARRRREQIGRQAGVLFGRMYQRSDELGMAMDARNMGTDVCAADATEVEPWRAVDFAFVICCIACMAGALWA